MVIVIGCGRMGLGLAKALSLRGHAVTVIDKDAGALEKLSGHPKIRTLSGVGFDREVLQQAGIESAEGLAAVTNSDEVNIVAAQIAQRKFRVPNVIARVYDPRKADIYKRLGLQTISTTAWGIERLFNILTHTKLEGLMLGSQLELIETDISAALAGHKVNELMIPGEASVIAIERGSQSFLPSPTTTLQVGDKAHLAVLISSLDKVSQLLHG